MPCAQDIHGHAAAIAAIDCCYSYIRAQRYNSYSVKSLFSVQYCEDNKQCQTGVSRSPPLRTLYFNILEY